MTIPKFRAWLKDEQRMIESYDTLAIDYENEEIVTQKIYSEDNHDEVKRFIGAFDIGFGEFHQMVTVSGSMWLHDYDYIIKNSDGECYPCAREVFEKAYKEVKK